MTSSKENLQKLLSLVVEISRMAENKWFLKELKNKLDLNSSQEIQLNNDLVGIISSDLNQIKKYLKIDVVPLIDYSEIVDTPVRNQLFRDCLEMGKYRLGKINDTINFDEFCRYAHLQSEELVNYYYQKKYSQKIDLILEVIKTNTSYAPKKVPESLNHIDFSFKLKALTKLLGLHYRISNVLYFLKDLRNEMSHRNSLSITQEEVLLNNFLQNKLNAVKLQDLKSLPSEMQELYNKGIFIITKREQDFNKIYNALDVLKSAILSGLSLRS